MTPYKKAKCLVGTCCTFTSIWVLIPPLLARGVLLLYPFTTKLQNPTSVHFFWYLPFSSPPLYVCVSTSWLCMHLCLRVCQVVIARHCKTVKSFLSPSCHRSFKWPLVSPSYRWGSGFTLEHFTATPPAISLMTLLSWWFSIQHTLLFITLFYAIQGVPRIFPNTIRRQPVIPEYENEFFYAV